MHATYSFLIDGNTKETALACFEEYAEKHCDGNNWYEILALITEGGEVVNCAAKGDWRGRDRFVGNSKILEMPEEARFDWAKKFALQCVVADMTTAMELSEFGSTIGLRQLENPDDKGYGDTIAGIMQNVPPFIAKMYEGFKPPAEGFDIEGYRRKKLSETFELFLTAKVKPFSTYAESPARSPS
jgi:hypothetical protein